MGARRRGWAYAAVAAVPVVLVAGALVGGDAMRAALVVAAVLVLVARDRLAPGLGAPDRRRDLRALLLLAAVVLGLVGVGLVVGSVR